jgi:hypothetical protein
MLKPYMLKLLLVLHKKWLKSIKICFQTCCRQRVGRTLIVFTLCVSQVPALYVGDFMNTVVQQLVSLINLYSCIFFELNNKQAGQQTNFLGNKLHGAEPFLKS